MTYSKINLMYLIFMLKTKQGGFMYHPSCFLEHLKYSYETKTPCFSHFAPTDQSVISKSRGGKNTFGRATDLRTLNLSSSVSLSLALVMNHRTDKAQGMIRMTHDEIISYPTQASVQHPSADVVSGFNPLYKSDCFLVTTLCQTQDSGFQLDVMLRISRHITANEVTDSVDANEGSPLRLHFVFIISSN